MTPTVLTVNPGFGVLKKQADALLFSLYGEVKLLRGAVRLIDHILDNVDEHRMKPELLQLVAQIYPQDAAAKILDQMIATGILSSITCGVLSVYSGIPSAIIRWCDITDTTVAILSWWAGFFICFVVLLFIYFVVERYYRHLEYHYNEALAKYKESSGKTK